MKKIDVKFYFWRFVKAFLTYFVSYLACSASFRSPLLSLLADSVDEDKIKVILQLLCLICYFLLPFVFFIFFQEADERKQRITTLYRQKPKTLDLVKEVFHSRDFYVNAVPLLALLVLFPPRNVLSFVVPTAFRSIFVLKVLFILLFYALPMLLFLLVAECFLRQDWHRQWRLCGFGFLEEGVADVPVTTKKRLALNLLLVFAAVYFLPSLTVYYQVARIGFKLVFQSGTLQLLIVFLILLPSLKGIREKKKLLREIKGRAESMGMRYVQNKNRFCGIFGLCKKPDFTIEGKSFVYEGRILPVRSKNANLVFFEKGVYRFEKQFIIWSLPFFTYRIPQPEAAGDKERRPILIPTKETKKIYYRDDGELFREIRTEDRVAGHRVEFSTTFLALLYKEGKR